MSVFSLLTAVVFTAYGVQSDGDLDVYGKCTNFKGELVDVGESSCSGHCMAPIFDQLEAAPIFGKIVKSARQDACKAAKITSAEYNTCKDRERELKVLGSKSGSTEDKVCFALSMLLGLDKEACGQIVNCWTEGDPEHCVGALKSQIGSVFEGRKRDLVNMAELSAMAYETLGWLSPHRTLVCPLTIKNPIDETIKLSKAVSQLLKELPKALYSVKQLTRSGGCRTSILMGLALDIQFGPMIKGEELGIYFDIGAGTWDKIFKGDKEYIKKLVKNLFREENDVSIGFYTSSSVKVSTTLGTEVEVGTSYSTLLGGPEDWSGYGYSIKFEAGLPNVIMGFGAAIEFELVFSARQGDNQINQLVGWKLPVKLEAGLEASPLSAEVGCAFANAAMFDTKGMVQKCGNNQKSFESEMKRIGQSFIESTKKNFNVKRDIMEEVAECTAAVECLKEECKEGFENIAKLPQKVYKRCSTNFDYTDECHSFAKKCDGLMKKVQTPDCIKCKHKEATNKCLTCKKHTCSSNNIPKSCRVAKSCKQPLTCKKPKSCNKPKTCRKAKSCKVKKCTWKFWECFWSAITDGTKCGWDHLTSGAECGWNHITSGAECGWNYVRSGTECGWEVVTNGAECGWDSVKDGAKCGWETVTKCVWDPIVDYTCQGADFACEKFEEAWVAVENHTCKGANYVCEAFESVTKCIGHWGEDMKECTEWAVEGSKKCAGDMVEVFGKFDGGALTKCARGVKKCTTLVPDFITDNINGRRVRRLMGDDN